MYNHYIPQSDGSYRRNTVPEQNRRPQPRPQPHREPPAPPKPEPSQHRPPEPKPEPCPPEPPHCAPAGEGILSFLKGLLPRQIDTADLMIVFLLLLMNKDCDDGLSPMITLALYFLL